MDGVKNSAWSINDDDTLSVHSTVEPTKWRSGIEVSVRRRAAARLGHAARDTDSAPKPNVRGATGWLPCGCGHACLPHGAHLPNSLSGTRWRSGPTWRKPDLLAGAWRSRRTDYRWTPSRSDRFTQTPLLYKVFAPFIHSCFAKG